MSLLIDVEMQFLGIKLHRPILESALAQFLGEPVEGAELPAILILESSLTRIGCRLTGAVDDTVVLQDLLRFLIGVAAVGSDDGMDDARGFDLGVVVEVEDDAERELILIGPERADEVAQPLGQHRDGAVDEIDRRGALLGFLVDDGSLGDVMADVGNMYADLIEAVVQLLDRQCVIEVLGILRVDGAGPHIAEVLTLGHILRRDLPRNLLGGVLHALRILIRQTVLRQDSVHLHVVVAALTEYVDHLADDALMLLVGPSRNLHHSLVVGLTALQLILGDEDVLRERILRRYEEGNILVDAQPSDEAVLGALQDSDDLRLLDVVAATGHERYAHAVAGEGRHRVALGHEDGLAAVVGLE